MPDVLALFSGAEAGLRGWTAGGHGAEDPAGCAAGSPICASHSTATAFRSAQHTGQRVRAPDCQCVAARRETYWFSLLAQPQWRKAHSQRAQAARGQRRTLALALPLDAKATPEELAKKIFDAKIDVVFNHGSYSTIAAIFFRPTAKFERQTRFMAVNSGAQQMVKLLGEDARGLVFTRWCRSGHAPQYRARYRVALEKVAPKAEPSFSSLGASTRAC